VVGFEPATLGVSTNGTAQASVVLDLPASSGGESVVLIDLNGLVSVPAGVLVQAGDLTATFDVEGGPVAGSDTVRAVLNGNADLPVEVSAGLSGTGLIFSQYLEGSTGTNKYVEITNIGTSDVDLSLCDVNVYSNGGTSPNRIGLSGTLGSGEVHLVCNGSFAIGGTCGTTSGSLSFNGDDAVELVCDGTVYDVIGQIGFDPGSEWGTAPLTTKDSSLKRSCSVSAGDADGSDAFDPADEWELLAVDDASDMGLPNTCP
jgi:hypothetical protein